MYLISSLTYKSLSKIGMIIKYFDTIEIFKKKKGGGVVYPLSPPLVSPETKFFCRKKKRIQIGSAMRIAPAEK